MRAGPPDDRVLAVLSRVLCGERLNGELDALPEPFGRVGAEDGAQAWLPLE